VAVVGALLVGVTLAAIGGQAVRANRTVSIQREAPTVRDAALDNAFYRCIDIQARSLVSVDEPVLVGGQLADRISLLKGVGEWVTIADPPSRAVSTLSLRDNVSGTGACLGTVVIATSRRSDGTVAVRIGSGASVPGKGPPPAPPL
jgi:hypothetical protein